MHPEPTGIGAGSATRRDFLTVDGMFCGACAASVEIVLNRHPGVASASVNFAADAAVVDWATTGGDRDSLIDAVRKLGYRARMIGDESAAEQPGGSPVRDLGLRLIVALFFGMWSMLPSLTLYVDVVTDSTSRLGLAIAAGAFAMPVIFFSGMPFYRMGINTLRHGVAGVDALILLGVGGSLLLSVMALARGSAEVFFEVAVALITLQLIGRILDLRLRRRARDAVIGLFELSPTTVRILDESGAEREVALKDVKIGARIRVRAGEQVAVDGNVVAGRADVDRSLLSGESSPILVSASDTLHAGERVLDGALTVEVTAAAGSRRIDELGRQVRQMLARKPGWQRIADLAAGYFLWIAAGTAVLGAVIALTTGGTIAEAGARTLAVFVIACPCALSLAAPLAGLAASGAAARRGMILRDLNAITSAAVPDRIFLDKTGTITRGVPAIVAVHPCDAFTSDEVLALAASAERDSDHPLAEAIKSASIAADGRAADAGVDERISRVVPGCGVIVSNDGIDIRVGQLRWLAREGVTIPMLPPTAATRVGVAKGQRFIGAVDLDDDLLPGILSTIQMLKARGIEPVILSGDGEGPVARVAGKLDIAAFAELTPEAKTDMINEARRAGETVAFAGDGLNDAPALAAADLGIAVSRATDAARTAAAVAFVEADASSLPELFELTARSRRIIHQNLAWACAYNAIAIPAAIAGWIHPAVAGAAMALSSIAIVLNALRAGRIRQA